MSRHRYDPGSLRADGLRAAAGLGISVLALLAVEHGLVQAVLGACAALFLAFGLRTWLRRRVVVEMGEDGIRATGLAGGGLFPWTSDCVSLRWQDLCMFRLRFFSTKRTRESGWMELTLKAPERTLRLDSTLIGFREIAARAARAASALGLEVGPTTVGNLQAMGLGKELRRPGARA